MKLNWYIGNLEIKNKVVLAPMAGISNPVFIKICEDMGAGYAITELISAEAIVRGNKKTFEMFKGIENVNIPVALQLFGSNPYTMARAAKIIEDIGKFKAIDINMGCPVPKVAIKNDAGSALLKNPEKVAEIVKEVSNSVNLPVTVKIRLGWDEKNINCVEIAKICEKNGAKAISIHARTRAQGYSGKADWSYIKKVVEAVNIPIIGNGDIINVNDAKRMLEETGCKAVMIGRGLLGNPWLIKDTLNYLENGKTPEKVNDKEKIDMMKYHLESLIKIMDEKNAVLQLRTHFLYYLKGMPGNADVKNKLCQTKSKEEVFNILDEYLVY